MATISDLENAYSKHVLTEYLKLLSEKELLSIQMDMLHDDIVGARADIFGSINNELEYRRSDEELAFQSFMNKK